MFLSGETFLVALLPCHALDTKFLYKAVTTCIQTIESAQGTVIALIWDNNRINQSCCNEFTANNKEKSKVVQHPNDHSQNLYLLFCTVHLLKNLRNNWIKEKIGKEELIDITDVASVDGMIFEDICEREFDNSDVHSHKLIV